MNPAPIRIAITAGEPAGIGAEVIVKALQHFNHPLCELVLIGDPALFQHAAHSLAQELTLQDFNAHTFQASTPACASIIPITCPSAVQPGKLNTDNSAYVIAILSKASELCLNNTCHAACTAPVSKSIINDAGIHFSGHTEFFSQAANCDKVVMMLATDDLRVALVTTHLALKDVPQAITREALTQSITILHRHLKQQRNISQPSIYVAGLNPHAGESGHLGREEIDTIIPCLEALRQQGIKLVGPLPADTLFSPSNIAHCDAFLAMYHDQGLPVLKYHGFNRAINITLGLPYIRTSVDHGTALDIAGQGIAQSSSMTAAIDEAYALCKNSHAYE